MVETSWDGETIFRIEQDGRQLYLGGKRNAKEPIQIWSERVGEIHKRMHRYSCLVSEVQHI